MAYTPKTWKDLPDETTPIKASDLNHMETGIYNNSKIGNENNSKIGNLNSLTTQNKSSTVDAINEIENLFESLKDELFYKNGDIWIVPDGYSIITGGHVTAGKKEIAFSIYTPKSMKNINSVTVSNAKITARQNGNYLVDSKIVNLKLQKRTDNCLYVLYTSPSEISNATNNDTVAIAFGNGTFTFSSTSVASDEESSDLETI